jgi:hypothetical protein
MSCCCGCDWDMCGAASIAPGSSIFQEAWKMMQLEECPYKGCLQMLRGCCVPVVPATRVQLSAM